MVSPLGRFDPVVDEMGKPTQKLQLFSEEVAALPLIIGTGSPEGIYESKAGRMYFNLTGGSGNNLYVKSVDSISGNRKNGWILT